MNRNRVKVMRLAVMDGSLLVPMLRVGMGVGAPAPWDAGASAGVPTRSVGTRRVHFGYFKTARTATAVTPDAGGGTTLPGTATPSTVRATVLPGPSRTTSMA